MLFICLSLRNTNVKTFKLKKDPTAESRKKDHINLAFESQLKAAELDSRFNYEPAINAFNSTKNSLETTFLGKTFKTPIWVSSMTGGTEKAKIINKNLAKACGEYGMGMGLGSCRALLESDERLEDFAVRKFMNDQPLYANLGVAQVEELIIENRLNLISELVKKLDADGLIIHINPLQEWFQPEGDRYQMTPVEMIEKILDFFPDLNIIVKEVGQGMGPKSLSALYKLPIKAVDFGSAGGTNFSILELLRANESDIKLHHGLARVGHSAEEMVNFANNLYPDRELPIDTIISGGVKNYLDGYYLTSKLNGNAIYGQASVFLRHALNDYEELQQYVEKQIEGLIIANSFLTV